MKKGNLVKNYIDTEADGNIKGMGLQKLRVAERLLNALMSGKRALFCAVEYIDDVVEIQQSGEKSDIRSEQNKNYSKAFSFNSEQVKNSFRIFFDNWKNVEYDENITFLFYTNTTIAKENKTDVIRDNNLKLPKDPILKLLIDGKYDEAIPIIVPIFKDYYLQQYKKHTSKKEDLDYYEQLIDGMGQADWKKFLGLIEWQFEAENEVQLMPKLLKLVKDLCYKFAVEEKYSEIILDSIIGLIEKQSMENEFLKKIVHISQIEVIFLRLAQDAKIAELIDPIHNRYDEITINDYRDIQRKVLSVCPDFDNSNLEDLVDEYVDGKMEQKSYPCIDAIKSYSYRIYKECRKKIRKKLNEKTTCNFSEEEIENLLDELTDISEKIILDKAKTYKVPYKDRDMIRKTILILMQECFISLDGDGDSSGQ